jgi:hypothetical protein
MSRPREPNLVRVVVARKVAEQPGVVASRGRGASENGGNKWVRIVDGW